MPSYKLVGKKGEITEVYVYESPIKNYAIYNLRYLKLYPTGELFIHPGYQWDFGSGPAVDTPAMVYASLAHDAMYELMQAGLVHEDDRKDIDLWFKELLKQAGVGWLRRQWVYFGVRLGYPIWKMFGGK